MNWIIESKAWEWIFSGIGLIVLAWIAKSMWNRKTGKRSEATTDESTHTTSGDTIHIDTKGGDVQAPSGKATSILVKNSNVGVIGDHTDVKNGINFTNKK